MEFGFSMTLPFVFKIGSPNVEIQLCALTITFDHVMKCQPSMLYHPIPILLVLCTATPNMNGLLDIFYNSDSIPKYFLVYPHLYEKFTY